MALAEACQTLGLPHPPLPDERSLKTAYVEGGVLCVRSGASEYCLGQRENGSPTGMAYLHAVCVPPSLIVPHNTLRLYCLGALEGEWASAGWCNPRSTTIALLAHPRFHSHS